PPAQLLRVTYSLVRHRPETAVRRAAFVPACREKCETARGMAAVSGNNCWHIMYLRIICGTAWQRNSCARQRNGRGIGAGRQIRLGPRSKGGSRSSIGPPARRKDDNRL